MTGYRDPLFPLPDPSFLLVHRVRIVRVSQLAVDTDDAGWPVRTGAERVEARGYVAAPDPRTLTPTGQAVDVVVLIHNDTAVDHRDMVEVPAGQALPTMLVGEFRINEVRPNAHHTRLLCTRVLDPAGAEA